MQSHTNHDEKPKLYIARHILQKIMYFVNACTNEISGMGAIKYDAAGNYFYVLDVHVLEQEVGPGATDIDATALGKLESEHLMEKRDGDLNFWWHSHVNMPVFWSGTDISTIKDIGKNGYCVATVFNKRGEMRSAIALNPSGVLDGMPVFMDALETVVYDQEPSKKTIAEWKETLTTKVKVKQYPKAVALPAKKLDGELPANGQNKGHSQTGTTTTKNSGSTTGTTTGAGTNKLSADVEAWQVPTYQHFLSYLLAHTKVILAYEPGGVLSKSAQETVMIGVLGKLDPFAAEIRYMDFTSADWDRVELLIDQMRDMLAINNFRWSSLTEESTVVS